MKENILLGLLIIFVGSCDNKSNNDNQHWRTDYEVDISTEIYTQTYPINYSLRQEGETTILTYITSQDTTIYRLQEDEKEGQYSSKGQVETLWLIDKKELLVNGETYPIYKYGMNMLVADGCTIHFWSPKLGILLTRSASWGSFSRIKASNNQKNNLTDQLSNIIMNDRKFYGGC